MHRTGPLLRARLVAALALAVSSVAGCLLIDDYDFGEYRPEALESTADHRDGGSDADGTDAAADANDEADAPPPCVPGTCAAVGAECGRIPDGCGGVLDCGECSTGYCGGGGTNRCGKTPCEARSCSDYGAQCGKLSDGCGGTLDCGTCPGQDVCTVDYRCVCKPKTCSELSVECGSRDDGCGTTLNCGGCPAEKECKDGNCVCKPKTCSELGHQCGSVSDGCGGTLDCGKCTGPQMACASTPTGNRCACQPKTCDDLKAECGSVSDGCGGTLDCGKCPLLRLCSKNNKCE
jgi:hypothetical protein